MERISRDKIDLVPSPKFHSLVYAFPEHRIEKHRLNQTLHKTTEEKPNAHWFLHFKENLQTKSICQQGSRPQIMAWVLFVLEELVHNVISIVVIAS